MAKTLSSVALVAPSGNIAINVGDNFAMTIDPAFGGSGVVSNYTLTWEWDQGTATWATIGTTDSDGLYHAGTNPLTTNTENNSTLTIYAGAAGTFNIRGKGNTYYTAERQVTVSAAAANLTVADAASVIQADAVVTTKSDTLAIADAACVTQADAVVTTKSDTLVIADAYCTTQADATLVTGILVVADCYVTTQADAVVVTGSTIDLVVADGAAVTQADAVTLQVWKDQPDVWISDQVWADVYIGV